MRNKSVLILLIFTFIGVNIGYSQVGIGTTAPTTTLDITAKNPTGTTTNVDGILIPRVDRQRAQSMTGVPVGTIIYVNSVATGAALGTSINITATGFYTYNGTLWELLRGDDWSTSGNATTGLKSIGTTSNQPFQFIANNIARGRVNPTDGEFVWGGTASPYSGDALCAVASATTTFAVNGYSAQNGSGIWGEVLTGSTTSFSAVQGVYGGSGSGFGVLGNYNGTGTSNTRAGVYGIVSQPAANAGGTGVWGYNGIGSGSQRMGLLGSYNSTAFGIGVHGLGFGGGIMSGNNDVAVVGWRANNANYSGYYNGNHVIANGTKSASVPTSIGNQLLYCMESPEVWFEDFGHGTLVNGVATIDLDPLYIETILIDDDHPMHVFVQVQGECEDVYVVPGKTSFTVKEKNGGISNVKFSYRLVAKRLHFPDHRFGNDPVWGPGDTRQYSERAPKRPLDYNEMVKQDEEAKRNWKPTPSPAITYPDMNEVKLTKGDK